MDLNEPEGRRTFPNTGQKATKVETGSDSAQCHLLQPVDMRARTKPLADLICSMFTHLKLSIVLTLVVTVLILTALQIPDTHNKLDKLNTM